jgi:hypothetical protein
MVGSDRSRGPRNSREGSFSSCSRAARTLTHSRLEPGALRSVLGSRTPPVTSGTFIPGVQEARVPIQIVEQILATRASCLEHRGRR